MRTVIWCIRIPFVISSIKFILSLHLWHCNLVGTSFVIEIDLLEFRLLCKMPLTTGFSSFMHNFVFIFSHISVSVGEYHLIFSHWRFKNVVSWSWASLLSERISLNLSGNGRFKEGSLAGWSLFLVLALQRDEERTTTSTLCSLIFFLTMCTGKNVCRFQNMES